MISEGDNVVVFWVMSGTHLGPLADLPATGKHFAITGITIYDFDEDGKVAGHIQAYDRLGFAGQMGILRG
jgi:predicted ester cyclase